MASARAWGARGRRFKSAIPDQSRHFKFSGERACSLAPLEFIPHGNAGAGLASQKALPSCASSAAAGNGRTADSFHIRKKSFDRFNQGNIFYILVLRDGLKNSFLILPSNEVEKKIKENAIFTVNNNTGYALNVKFRDQKIYLGNTEHEMSYFLDDWNLIK